MMFLNLFYRFDDCLIASMLKHPGIIVDQFESTHYSLNRFNEVSNFM